MAQPQPKPKYILKGPRDERVEKTVYKIVESGGSKSLIPEQVVETQPCWHLYIPHGPKGKYNSIRIMGQKQLVELKLDPSSTPLIDPTTGEIVGSFNQRVSQDYGLGDLGDESIPLDKKK